jgi:glycerol-3-phosphate O-acyltransferase
MNQIAGFLRGLLEKPIAWLVSVKSVPADIETELGIDKTRPIVYLLQTKSFTDAIALKKSARELGLPDPNLPILLANRQ